MRRRATLRAGVAVGAALALAATTATFGRERTTRTKALSGSLSGDVLYSNNYVFNSDALAKQWWGRIAAGVEGEVPERQAEPRGRRRYRRRRDEQGGAALPRQVAGARRLQLPTTYVSQFGGSGFLADLSKYVSSASPRPSGRSSRRTSRTWAASTAPCTRSTAATTTRRSSSTRRCSPRPASRCRGSRRRGTTSSPPRDW